MAKLHAKESMMAGAIAGGTTRLITAPFDLIKIRFQLQKRQSHAPSKFFSSFVNTIAGLYREEGYRTFWRGNLAATYLWISYSGVQFGVYRCLSDLNTMQWAQDSPKLKYAIHGSIAGMTATFCTYPFDLIRTIFAAQGVPKRYTSISALIRGTLQTDGVQGLYKGIFPSLGLIAPYMGISFSVYEALKSEQTFSPGICGAISGFTSKLIVYPLDTIKKRMQMQGTSASGTPEYRNAWDCCRKIFKSEGFFAFYRGTTPSVLKSIVGQSCTFAIYEFSLKTIQRMTPDNPTE